MYLRGKKTKTKFLIKTKANVDRWTLTHAHESRDHLTAPMSFKVSI